MQENLKDHKGDTSLDVQQMLKEMKNVIKSWNLTQNDNIFNRLADAKFELDKAEHDKWNDMKIHILRMEVYELSLIRDCMLKQKS